MAGLDGQACHYDKNDPEEQIESVEAPVTETAADAPMEVAADAAAE